MGDAEGEVIRAVCPNFGHPPLTMIIAHSSFINSWLICKYVQQQKILLFFNGSDYFYCCFCFCLFLFVFSVSFLFLFLFPHTKKWIYSGECTTTYTAPMAIIEKGGKNELTHFVTGIYMIFDSVSASFSFCLFVSFCLSPCLSLSNFEHQPVP